jgi:hypothetical protein
MKTEPHRKGLLDMSCCVVKDEKNNDCEIGRVGLSELGLHFPFEVLGADIITDKAKATALMRPIDIFYIFHYLFFSIPILNHDPRFELLKVTGREFLYQLQC